MKPSELILQHVTLPFEGELHSYQKEDIDRLSQVESCGLFLDLGLGKTVVASLIGAYKLLTEDFYSCHVLCPDALVVQWVGTLKKMGLRVAAYRGTPKQREKIDLDQDFLVMSYQIFQRDYDKLKDIDAYYIIDEATVMCNQSNLLYKMLEGGEVTKKKKVEGRLIPQINITKYPKANRGISLLTATPINKPVDSYGLISILNPNAYKNYTHFLRSHVAEVDYFDQPKEYMNLEGMKANLLKNATLRSAADHLELPPIIFKTVKYKLSPKHMSIYDKLLEERMIEYEGEVLIEATQATALYNWAQKIIFNPYEAGFKGDPVGVEILDGLVKSVNKFLIFGNYRLTNGQLMDRYNIGAAYGGVTSKQQDKFVKDFQEGDLRGLQCHVKSGGYGLDLPMCQHVFFPEMPITPRDFRQACGRVFRQGQKKTVVVTMLVAKGTIQDSLFSRIMDNDDLMKEVVDSSRSLREDLLSDTVIADQKFKVEDVLSNLRGDRSE